MKKLIALVFILFTLHGFFQATAQTYIPNERMVEFGNIQATAWVIAVGEENTDDIKKGWAGYARRTLDVKVKKDGRDALIAREIQLPEITSNVGDLRMKIINEEGQSLIAVAFITGYSTFLSIESNPVAADKLRQISRDFVKTYKLNAINESLAVQSKRKKSLEVQYISNEREHKKIERQIAKNEKRMQTQKIEKNEKFQLQNKNISLKARLNALTAIMINQKNELIQVQEVIEKLKLEINFLEKVMGEPLT